MSATTRLPTDIAGLDEVLLGGLQPGKTYMVRGIPGAGKTTLAMQFLIAGARNGESVLFVTLSESETELRDSAAAHGWDLEGVRFLDIHPEDDWTGHDGQYTIFHPADVELAPVTKRITEAIEVLRPTRIAFDSLTEVRLLTRDPLRYRRQLLALKNYLINKGITALFLGESARQELDVEVASIVQGVISLSMSKGREGMVRRTVEVEKFRGSGYREGEHSMRITPGGLEVYPRLIAQDHGRPFDRDRLPGGIAALDRMLGGGLDRGTTTLISGNAGVGKTTLAVSFLIEAARRGEMGIFYSFDEGPDEIAFRCRSIGMDPGGPIGRGEIQIRKVNPQLLYPDEFATWIRRDVEERGARLVVVDSLNGYSQSMPDEDYLPRHLHQLVTYLNRMGTTTILVHELSNLTGDLQASGIGISYLADTILLLKYYEHRGAMHKAIGALKKRLSAHETTLRSFAITPSGIQVGDPMPDMQGILRGTAEVFGDAPKQHAAPGA